MRECDDFLTTRHCFITWRRVVTATILMWITPINVWVWVWAWLNSMFKFASLTQLRLNSFESRVVSQNWLTTHHILPNWAKSCWQGGGVLSNAALGWFFPHDATDNCKILTFSLPKNQWLNFDSSSIQLTQLWLKLQSAWFDSDSTHILEFHWLLNSVAREIHARRRLIWVRVESNLTHDSSRAQLCSAALVLNKRFNLVPINSFHTLSHHHLQNWCDERYNISKTPYLSIDERTFSKKRPLFVCLHYAVIDNCIYNLWTMFFYSNVSNGVSVVSR